MPYIKQERRKVIDPKLNDLVNVLLKHGKVDESVRDGDLNYVITYLLKSLYDRKYREYNSAMGVLACVTQEFYRTVVALYEDEKRVDQGDVFGQCQEV